MEKTNPNELLAVDIFTPDNTEWEDDFDDEGHHSQHLVYCGSLEDYADELGISYDRAYELLGEYEDISNDLVQDIYEREAEYKKVGGVF